MARLLRSFPYLLASRRVSLEVLWEKMGNLGEGLELTLADVMGLVAHLVKLTKPVMWVAYPGTIPPLPHAQ